jgi:hypothetical protein
MGNYTELIFGARLKDKTPEFIINTIRFLMDEEIPLDKIDPNLPEYCTKLRGASSYFGVTSTVNKLYRESDSWVLSSRFNKKNYDYGIETFLAWIKPYINYGSGANNMYAIVINELDSEPMIYYLNDSEN